MSNKNNGKHLHVVPSPLGTELELVADVDDVIAEEATLPELISVTEEKLALEPLRPRSVVVRQVATVAATGFILGAASFALVRARQARHPVLRRRGSKKKGILGEVLGTNSFLVDVHFIRRK